MIYLDFPSRDDWENIVRQSPLEQFRSFMKELDNKNRSESREGIFGFMDLVDAMELTRQLAYRLDDVIKSYVMLVYYYGKGIPDDEWYNSPGEDGASIQFHPNFDKIHAQIKDWFDFYSDIFYFKLFSAWDIVGHILKSKYDLDIKKIDFRKAVKELRNKDKELYSKLKNIESDPAFEKARKIRNNITHNYLPSSTGLAVTRHEKEGSVGVRDYTTSSEIMKNVQDIVGLFEKTLLYISS